ncbi:peptidase [Pacificimonas flava]|uniref:Peptidase n=2 Tax=Pacificimonas TaxID=1960290 RepID=A0A219B5I1_9SPHN|nr:MULTISPECIES: zinc-dependent metalloprotease [Pacificimonas]MBZ6377233.1 zinc-dependent metalloprotease [Pacificimonas aurantium]OWV33049.1 peptidase [Pacificimonas flava]
MRGILLGAAAFAALTAGVAAPAHAELKPAAEVLAGTERQGGLLPVHVDADSGRVLLELPAPGEDGLLGRFLHVSAVETGLGSAPVGIDRARSSGGRVLAFRRIGSKVIAEVENLRFRAAGAPDLERQSVENSFAVSTIWTGDVAARTASGGVLVDISSFLVRDDLGLAAALKGEGGFKLEDKLSVADTNFVKVFPENVELRGRLTFTSSEPGREVSNITPVSGNLTIAVRHSFLPLPEPGYQPRRFDPRAGSFGTQVVDFGAPLGQPLVYELANRFRLEKTDPAAASSPVRDPIVFHIDPSAPEPVRTALYEGVSWWSDAFAAAGLIDAFRVEYLPEDADPLDARYNVVNWVNRATRGWSYGQTVTDPRTGEIVTGTVLLGSLRVRQDLMIFEALVGANLTGTGDPNDPVTAALARIRQLGAHEVGHALGFAHNFAGSGQGRYSVMDYPAPRIALVDGRPDITDAYGVGIGRWDEFAVDWLYGADNEAEAAEVMQAGLAEGLRFVSDADARGLGAAHPAGSLWDDFDDPVAELRRMLDVREAAVAQFGPQALGAGQPLSQLKRAFVPIWLLHRYQVEAAGKLLGGVDYRYALRGDGTGAASAVPGVAQRDAMQALLAALDADALTVPDAVLPYLSAGYSGDYDRQTAIEIMPTLGAAVFDPLQAAEVAAAVPLDVLLAPERLARLESQHAADADVPGPLDVVDAVIDTGFDFDGADARQAAVQRRIATVAALSVARTAANDKLGPALSFALTDRLEQLADRLETRGDSAQASWQRGLAELLRDPDALREAIAKRKLIPDIPPGMPIGSLN